MDLNKTNEAKIHEFYKKLEEIFIFQQQCSNLVCMGWLIGEVGIKTAKFQHNLSIIMPAR